MEIKNPRGVMYVHGTKFHLDDALCAAMGYVLGYSVQRTMDKEICNHCQVNDLVCDIGRQYDGVRFFDHHQQGVPCAQEVGLETRFPFAKVAAAGLFWARYTREIIRAIDPNVPEEVVPEIKNSVDLALIAPSDRVDTGDGEMPLGITSFSTLLAWFNPEDQDNAKFDAAFFDVVDQVVYPTFVRCIKKMLSKVYSRKFIEAAPIVENTVIVLDKYAPWQSTVTHNPKFDSCLYCVYPSLRGGWNGQVIPTSPTVNAARKDFPLEWAGLTDRAFCNAAQVAYSDGDNYFCHVARFLIAAPTKEKAIQLCMKAAHA